PDALLAGDRESCRVWARRAWTNRECEAALRPCTLAPRLPERKAKSPGAAPARGRPSRWRFGLPSEIASASWQAPDCAWSCRSAVGQLRPAAERFRVREGARPK